MKTIKKSLLLLAFFAVLFLIYSLKPRVPYNKSSYGISLEKSDTLSKDFQESLQRYVKDTASRMQNVMVLHKGKIIFESGDTKKVINCHSARKSILSLLFGIAQDKGLLNLDETLGQIGIDESKTPLTQQEKSATIRDLLKSTSGIFLKAEAEHDWADDIRPKRGKYQPGEFFFYNNFDFNVLGAILQKKTRKRIGTFMEEHLAKPLAFEEFSQANVVYNSPWPVPTKSDSDYPVYWMFLSTRDFAKIGQLVIQKGKWKEEQIIPTEWFDESLQPYSSLEKYNDRYNPYEAFAYSWWLDNDTKTIWADGFGGQFMCIDTTNNLVVVQRNFTGNSLLSSGLWLIDKNKDNNPKDELIYVYERVKEQLGL